MRAMKACFLASAVLLAVATLRAGDEPGFTAETAVYNQYIWRGLVLTNGPVLQTSGTLTYKQAHFNVWSNLDLDSVNGRRGKLNELDFDAGYDRPLGERATLSGGVTRYTFPNTPFDSTAELYGGVSLATFLHPSLRGYFDVDAIRGAYVTLDVSHGVALPKPSAHVAWSLEFAAGAAWGSSGYNQGYFQHGRSGMVDFHPSLALPVAIGKHCKVTPRLGYTSLLDKGLRASEAAAAHSFFGGASLSFAF